MMRISHRRLETRERALDGIVGPPRFLLPRALPHHAGISLERRKLLATVCPFRRFGQREMIARLAAGARFEQSTRNVHPFGGAGGLERERRSRGAREGSRRARPP